MNCKPFISITKTYRAYEIKTSDKIDYYPKKDRCQICEVINKEIVAYVNCECQQQPVPGDFIVMEKGREHHIGRERFFRLYTHYRAGG